MVGTREGPGEKDRRGMDREGLRAYRRGKGQKGGRGERGGRRGREERGGRGEEGNGRGAEMLFPGSLIKVGAYKPQNIHTHIMCGV